MSLSGLKDVDREILQHVDDRELLEICTVDRKTWNEVCDDAFLRRRLISKYPGIEEYKREDESWKRFFLNVIYYISKMKDDHQFEYKNGDFYQQYHMLDKYKGEKDDLLVTAATKGELDLVKYALESGADINAYNNAAIINARNLNVVKYLVEHGADIHVLDEFPLHLAIEDGNFELVKYLVEQGADIHVMEDYAFQIANYTEILNYLNSRIK